MARPAGGGIPTMARREIPRLNPRLSGICSVVGMAVCRAGPGSFAAPAALGRRQQPVLANLAEEFTSPPWGQRAPEPAVVEPAALAAGSRMRPPVRVSQNSTG